MSWGWKVISVAQYIIVRTEPVCWETGGRQRREIVAMRTTSGTISITGSTTEKMMKVAHEVVCGGFKIIVAIVIRMGGSRR